MKTMFDELISRSHQDVATAAYLLWEQLGRPEGCDLDIWLQAEDQLIQQLKQLCEIQEQGALAINHSTASNDSFPMEISVKRNRMGLLNSTGSLKQTGETKKRRSSGCKLK